MTDITKTHLEPTLIAPETFLIHDHEGEGTAPVCVPLNTMVIRGAEPVVVDTGMAENREQYLADVFSLVEPEDIRWVFISHDDVDHTGNLNALMDRACNATLVINWFMTTRMGASLEVPPTRQRWVGDGEGLDVGDRVLQAVRPPIFDSPTTRGLYDPTTGVYWSSDSFATPMPHPMATVAELDDEFWLGGMTMFDNYVSPWLDLVDDAKFQATVDRVAGAAAHDARRLPHAGRQRHPRGQGHREHPPLPRRHLRPRARPDHPRAHPGDLRRGRRVVAAPTLSAWLPRTSPPRTWWPPSRPSSPTPSWPPRASAWHRTSRPSASAWASSSRSPRPTPTCPSTRWRSCSSTPPTSRAWPPCASSTSRRAARSTTTPAATATTSTSAATTASPPGTWSTAPHPG